MQVKQADYVFSPGWFPLTCGQPSSQAPFAQVSLKREDVASFMASDLRFLFPQDCLGASPARRRLCWLVLIMAVRGFARTDPEGGGRVTESWLRLCLRARELLAVAHPGTCVQWISPAAACDFSVPVAPAVVP